MSATDHFSHRFFACRRLALVSALLLCGGAAQATVPVRQISYQGKLTQAGQAVNSTLSITFRLYDAASGGTMLWSETQSVAVGNGLYAVQLGSVTPLNLAFDAPYYLGVQIGSGAEMTPRQALSSVPYAMLANTANTATTVANGAITAASLGEPCATGQTLLKGASGWACGTISGASGATGPAGATGATGATGPSGPAGATGPAGTTGSAGPVGAVGATGATGPAGATGAAGATGPSGATGAGMLTGTVDPAAGDGNNGDSYYNSTTRAIFGPKAGGTWPAGVSLAGATGATGAAGPAGATGATGPSGATGPGMLTGTVDPAAGDGNNGDFYYNSATRAIFGPKAGGTWPAGVSLAGATGATGATGLAGATGPAGATGSAGPAGAAGATGATGPAGAAGVVGPTGATGPAGTAALFGTGTSNAVAGTQPDAIGCMLGQVILIAGRHSADWTRAMGQILSIAQNSGLYAIMGATYGGDNTLTFALPDLRAAAPNGLTYVICTRGFYPS